MSGNLLLRVARGIRLHHNLPTKTARACVCVWLTTIKQAIHSRHTQIIINNQNTVWTARCHFQCCLKKSAHFSMDNKSQFTSVSYLIGSLYHHVVHLLVRSVHVTDIDWSAPKFKLPEWRSRRSRRKWRISPSHCYEVTIIERTHDKPGTDIIWRFACLNINRFLG